MTETHEEIEELLAGYSLGALSGEDAATTDRLLTDHVPRCPRCQAALTSFQAVAGELALEVAPASPPDLVEARIRRGLEDSPSGRRGRGPWWAAAVASVVALGLLGWNLALTREVSEAQEFQATMLDGILTAADPRAENVRLTEEQGPDNLYLAYVPEGDRAFLMGANVPAPRAGHVYWVWFGADDEWTPVKWFVPSDGLVAVEITEDLEPFNRIWICQEVEGNPVPTPSEPVWGAPV
jgi:Anti-sigma-K factor rskA